MLCKRPPLVMLITLFLVILIAVLPACASNATTETTTAAPETTVPATAQTTVATNQTTVPATTQATATATTQTTVATTQQTTAATSQTTVPTTTQTAAVTTQTTVVVTTAKPATTVTTAVTTGAVNVYSSPAGASILIDSVYCGTTPKTVQGVPAGNHILRLTLSGYQDYEGSIYIVAGQTAQGYGTLQPISQGSASAPSATVVVPVIVPVATPTPQPTDDSGFLGNSSVIVAIIGAIGVIIASAASVFTHVRPPKKE